jgi:hypothetical protein
MADAVADAHGWGDNSVFPSHAIQGAVNLKSFGAVGDGVYDARYCGQHFGSRMARYAIPLGH